MSRAATEQNLFSLLPGINTLPAELVSLANSLLAQSRTKAPNLRPDEEIARGYVVANIACERCVPPQTPQTDQNGREDADAGRVRRLKTRLDLPDIAPKPPCPRRVYAKLLGYLGSALSRAPAPAPAAGRKRALPERGVASPPSPAGKRARADGGELARQQRRDHDERRQEEGRERHPRQDGEGGPPRRAALPAWTTRFARALCASSPPAAAAAGGPRAWLTGHVVAGLETVAASAPPPAAGPAAAERPGAPAAPAPRRRGRPPGSGRRQAAALAARAAAAGPTARLAGLALAAADVAARAAGLAPLVPGGGAAAAAAAAAAADALALLEEAGAFAAAGEGEGGAGRPDAAALGVALGRALGRAEDEGWLRAEWADNVRAVASAMRIDEDAAVAGADDPEAREAERDRVGLGGGEMLLFAEDWLSAERRRGFAAWKAGVLSRIEAVAP